MSVDIGRICELMAARIDTFDPAQGQDDPQDVSSEAFMGEPFFNDMVAAIARESVRRADEADRGNGPASCEPKSNAVVGGGKGKDKGIGSDRATATDVSDVDSVERMIRSVKNLSNAESLITATASGAMSTCLGRFRHARRMREGNFGTVYSVSSAGEPESTGKPGSSSGEAKPKKDKPDRYALKTIFITRATPKRILRTVGDELTISKRMGELGVGPRVHKVHVCEENGGALVMIVMQLMDKGDIDEFIIGGGLVTAEHLDQLRAKLKVMHDEGYTHNDIHPGNILVSAAPEGGTEIFLADFGLSTKNSSDKLRQNDLRRLNHVMRGLEEDFMRKILLDLVRTGSVRW